jgi:hypothetical protein
MPIARLGGADRTAGHEHLHRPGLADRTLEEPGQTEVLDHVDLDRDHPEPRLRRSEAETARHRHPEAAAPDGLAVHRAHGDLRQVVDRLDELVLPLEQPLSRESRALLDALHEERAREIDAGAECAPAGAEHERARLRPAHADQRIEQLVEHHGIERIELPGPVERQLSDAALDLEPDPLVGLRGRPRDHPAHRAAPTAIATGVRHATSLAEIRPPIDVPHGGDQTFRALGRQLHLRHEPADEFALLGEAPRCKVGVATVSRASERWSTVRTMRRPRAA